MKKKVPPTPSQRNSPSGQEVPGGTEVRLVAVTGWGTEQDRARTRAAGFDLHLTKPIDLRTLDGLLAAL